MIHNDENIRIGQYYDSNVSFICNKIVEFKDTRLRKSAATKMCQKHIIDEHMMILPTNDVAEKKLLNYRCPYRSGYKKLKTVEKF